MRSGLWPHVMQTVPRNAHSVSRHTHSPSTGEGGDTPDMPKAWLDMTDGCVKEMKRQIQAEIDASMTYLAMGAHFSQDSVNRPGFAKFFFESAAEEREHGHKLIEYLLMRGQLTSDLTNLIQVNPPSKTSWKSGAEALKDALRTEAKVTKSIRQVIETCEDDSKFNDYHVSFGLVWMSLDVFFSLGHFRMLMFANVFVRRPTTHSWPII